MEKVMAQNIEPTSKGWMRPFLFIWTAQTISILGSSVAQFALIWWLTQSTGSATVLSTATLVAFIPEVFLGPFAGALVDRWNRKLVLILSDLIVAAFAVLLILSFAFGFQAVWQVYFILFLRALSG
ncbi:MFS transporter, partial [bacterium]|nr:MFS transporter [bacterium]